jgi:retron-type reverse transcriptase
MSNLILAWRKARKHKTKKDYVIEFEASLIKNLLKLQGELKNQTYKPKPLVSFIVEDPKTRKISKSAFRDRIVHHALCNVIEPIFEKRFIYDSCANRIGKGNLFALKRFDLFKNKITKNKTREAFCLKADIKHYFDKVNHEVLISILEKRISDKKVIWLIKQILDNFDSKEKGTGMPLGNLTSQFFANVYLSELDYFIKHQLKVKYFLRYVDDFVVLHDSKEQLINWGGGAIGNFLRDNLKLELHPDKSKICILSRGIDFVGFRNFSYHRLLRKRNIRKILVKITIYKRNKISKEKLIESFQGWNAYAKWANTYKLREKVKGEINKV